ncbi:hypothetical protein HOY82DRAFT_127641 [Tuber indicum]|nr:hypothetical protein HOY82DRAFT_127641 [Tuber indicum]
MAHTPSLIIHISPLRKSQRGRGFGGGDSLQKGIFSPPSESYLFARVLTLCTIFFLKYFSSVSRFDLLAFFSVTPNAIKVTVVMHVANATNRTGKKISSKEGRERKKYWAKKGVSYHLYFPFLVWCIGWLAFVIFISFHFFSFSPFSLKGLIRFPPYKAPYKVSRPLKFGNGESNLWVGAHERSKE